MFALFSRRLRTITHAALGCVLVAALLCAQPSPVRAAGTVGDGTSASCTSLALANAITAGSGDITFACGAAPVTIVIMQPGGLVIPNGVNITMDGKHQIELSGGLAWRVFVVNGGGSLTLKNLSIVKGYNPSDGGAIANNGTLTIEGCTFTGNQTAAPSSGGAIVSYGPLNISNSEFSHNQAGNGGAVYVRFAAALTVITGTTFDYNITTNGTNGWGGAMLLWDGAPVTLVQDIFHDNAGNFGGALFVQGSSSLTISATQFYSNLGQITPSTGGAIYSQGTLSVTDSEFEANHAGNSGAIFMESGATNILRSSFTRNWAVNSGGAYGQATGVLLAANSWFNGNGYDLNDNPVTFRGGALDIIGGSATLNNLTLSGNWAGMGGGFFQSGTATLQNVTFSGNHASLGGGTYVIGNLTLTNVTLYQNSATSGGGGIKRFGGTITVRNTIVANNTGGNCDTPIASNAFSLSSDSSCGFGIGRDNVIIQLMALYNYGGFAPTHLPYAGSPAVDNATLLYCPTTDQRGVVRPQGAGCDVGAVERIPGGELVPVAFLPFVRR